MKLPEKNSILFGILLGTLLPAIGFALFYGLYSFLEDMNWVSDSGFRPMFRERTSAILAIALNAIALNSYQKRYLHNTVRGIVVMTTVWVILWIVVFGKYVF